MTIMLNAAQAQEIAPPWSQPRIWPDDADAMSKNTLEDGMPQWSQPRIGWMTPMVHRTTVTKDQVANGAGREPAG